MANLLAVQPVGLRARGLQAFQIQTHLGTHTLVSAHQGDELVKAEVPEKSARGKGGRRGIPFCRESL